MRKDELNSLQFALGEENEARREGGKMLLTTISKSFKVRKIQGKMKEGSEVLEMLKVRFDRRNK